MTYQSKTPSPENRETGPAEGIGLDEAHLLLEIRADAKPAKSSTFAFETVLSGRQEVTLGGRNRWLLRKLIERGNRGLTAAECPAGLRLAAMVHRLRRAGVAIDSEIERHEGQFAGHHARYRLGTVVSEI
jgi:hypothetical protein